MPCLLIRHTVQDYTTWASVFDEHESTRRANGSQGSRLVVQNGPDLLDPFLYLEGVRCAIEEEQHRKRLLPEDIRGWCRSSRVAHHERDSPI